MIWVVVTDIVNQHVKIGVTRPLEYIQSPNGQVALNPVRAEFV